MLNLGKVSKETRGQPLPQNKIGAPGETFGSQLRKFV